MSQKFTRKEVSERGDKKNVLFIIDNVVYNVTDFLDEHPGGHEVLVHGAGEDVTENFDDIGHSLDAKELMKKYVVGEVVAEDRIESKKRQLNFADSSADSGAGTNSWLLPVVLGIIATVIYVYLFG